MIDQQLAEISSLAIMVTIILYVLALIGFAADLASTSQRRSDAKLAQREQRELVAAGGASLASADAARADAAEPAGQDPSAGPSAGTPGTMSAQTFAFVLVGIGTALHLVGVATRSGATKEVPWTNMYEFATTSTAIVMLAFLVFSIRRRELRVLGTFVLGPVLVALMLAQLVWIVPAAELTPSLQNSHWIYIHIAVAVLATSLSILGAVVASLQLLQARHERAGEGRWGAVGRVLDRLPSSTVLEGLSFRIHSVGFVCWTFTLIFGAIWAREAWGRYWGWDPKEVWTFIIWVIYAAYLHARTTGGFRGSRAAWLALAGFLAVVFNYTIVNTVINGLHSYSGL
ncbi:c-type cytochrome biogenesis protein CcsB [Brachybacterium sp. J144]|uniref:c-type cytochrome biogenesis protein CcsB n=1 Tax=Brachybacterium sp. J144 TaxID=3116487 RepID=UPI002E76FE5C|nr:c-type cytochrome biogenesis protein CcsB [Brachybacterium sp. J144]MEE1651874.1 c-type cytochrome biogenesis protein CcsB [Brachybacterium sp. J144]